MSVVSKLNPHGVFAGVLDGKVEVHTSATASHTIKAYKYGKQPNKGLADEFIVVQKNGSTSAKTEDGFGNHGELNGYLAVIVNCKLQTDNTAKENRIQEILAQIEEAAKRKTYGVYYYWLDPDNLLQDTTPNTTSGYSTTAINVRWRTNDDFYKQEL